MNYLKDLWNDQGGAVLSAEVVLVGTVAVLGGVVGLNMAATAVNDELKEFAYAIRSLDQSYGYLGHQSCRAWAAGSYYRQPDVQQSLQELCGQGTPDFVMIQREVDAQRAALSTGDVPDTTETPPPNELPTPAQ
uniref:Histidine kinase n=1 Tax=Schlesneria paludicola TaxID=360056 RepID=A0A7C4QR48_9PLAN